MRPGLRVGRLLLPLRRILLLHRRRRRGGWRLSLLRPTGCIWLVVQPVWLGLFLLMGGFYLFFVFVFVFVRTILTWLLFLSDFPQRVFVLGCCCCWWWFFWWVVEVLMVWLCWLFFFFFLPFLANVRPNLVCQEFF